MKYRPLGRTGLQVSEVGFGCWAIGGTGYGPTEDGESLKALEAGWEGGINFFDTADVYGDGHSEDLLAGFFKGKPRDKFIVASKSGWDFYHDGGNRKNFDADYIRFAVEESLKRLKVDTIDLQQLHNPSVEKIKTGEAVSELEKLKKEGKIRFIGISVHTEDEAFAAMEDPRVDVLQLVFNLLNQRMAEKVFPEAQEKKIGILAREPLANGLLTGKFKPGHKFAKTDHRNRWTAEKLEQELKKVDMVRKVMATERLTLTRAALEYVLDFDAVSTVIPGAKTVAQIKENMEASNNPLLRIQESFLIREMYKREEIFKKS